MFEIFRKLFGKASSSTSRLQEIIGDGAVVIDVRTPYEFRQGHLPGSRNIPLDVLPSKIEDLRKLNKTIITVCRSGARSSTAKNILTTAGLDACNGGPWTSLKALFNSKLKIWYRY